MAQADGHGSIMRSLGELDQSIDERITREKEYIRNIKTGLLVIINRLQVCAEDALENGADPDETGEILDALNATKSKLQQTPPFQVGNVQSEVDSVINPLRDYANVKLRKVNDPEVDPGELYPDLDEADHHGGWKTKSKRRSRRSNRTKRRSTRSKR